MEPRVKAHGDQLIPRVRNRSTTSNPKEEDVYLDVGNGNAVDIDEPRHLIAELLPREAGSGESTGTQGSKSPMKPDP